MAGKNNMRRCIFCDHIIGGGGITRVKNHLENIDATKNVKLCDKVSPKVKEEMRVYFLAMLKRRSRNILWTQLFTRH